MINVKDFIRKCPVLTTVEGRQRKQIWTGDVLPSNPNEGFKLSNEL